MNDMCIYKQSGCQYLQTTEEACSEHYWRHLHVSICMYEYMYVCMSICMYVWVYVCMYVWVYVCMYEYMYVWVYVMYEHICAHVQVCISSVKLSLSIYIFTYFSK